MNAIEKMIADREKIRSAEIVLTKQINIERKRLQDEKKQEKKTNSSPSKRSVDEFKKLQAENSKLKQLLAIMYKDKGVTYKKIGETIGLSGGRVRQIVEQQMRFIRWDDTKNCDES
jgi:DNA-directed RNA polymerase sigma subunit (sigma70/sigma32)